MSRILCVDDDKDILDLLVLTLSGAGFEATAVSDPSQALARAAQVKPDLILLDVMMPRLSGYEVCAALRAAKETAEVPVIFLSALGQRSDKLRALSLGAADFVTKPFKKEPLLALLRQHLARRAEWTAAAPGTRPAPPPASVIAFRRFLLSPGNPGAAAPDAVERVTPSTVYSALAELRLTPLSAAKLIAGFLKLQFISIINPDNIRLGVLPPKFAKSSGVVALQDEEKGLLIVVANPFDMELTETLGSLLREPYSLAVAAPDAVSNLYDISPGGPQGSPGLSVEGEGAAELAPHKNPDEQAAETPVKYITAKLLEAAIQERASDVHIEPKELFAAVRFRIDGELREFAKLKKDTAAMALARLKVLAGMDITERRRPQDGAFVAALGNRKFTLRLSTTSTSYGESMVIRLIEPQARPRTLYELGMDKAQAETMLLLSAKTQGMIIIAGPTGSGKTTTIYSFLSNIDCQRRSLISVEDPIEFRIPHANQQQVNDKRGVTFDALLKSSVRQDPDILFLGEIRDKASAQIALDFSSTGHLTVSTIHTSNAATAVFRLERLGVTRPQIADTVLAVVSQRLIKRLCPECRVLKPAEAEALDVYARFNLPAPARTASPAGCPSCGNTGYSGREAVYEIITMTPEVSELIRSGASVSAIRESLRRTGITLITSSALAKVSQGTVAFRDAYEKVIAEDLGTAPAAVDDGLPPGRDHLTVLPDGTIKEGAVYVGRPKGAAAGARRILVVDDDPDILLLAEKVIAGAGYSVTAVKDGIEAVMRLSAEKFDLVLSDIDMPNLDGLRLLEILNQKNIKVAVVFFTARQNDDSEQRGLALGALDYIRKPVRKEVLLLRIQNIFARERRP